MKRLTPVLSALGLAVCGLSQGTAHAATVPVNAIAGSAQVTTTDWCNYEGPDLPPAGQRRWVDQMDLSLVLRINGRGDSSCRLAVSGMVKLCRTLLF